jgi:branched-chain amino acid transport system permease protein
VTGDLDDVLRQLPSGVVQGAIYALIALGYSLVYGILGMINFAHGEVYMVGAYVGIVALAAATAIGLPLPALLAVALAVAAAVAVCASYGATIERVAYRPLRNAHALAPLISAIGVSTFLQNFVRLAQGNDNKQFPEAYRGAFGGGSIAWIEPPQPVRALTIVAVAVAVMVAFHLFTQRTRTGTAMRACSMDRTMAALVGVNVDRVIGTTFAIGSGLAALAGVMVSMHLSQATYTDGYLYGMKAFTAAVLGGIGNLPGAMLGGIVLGVVEAAGVGLFGGAYRDAYSFIVLMAVLVVRPRGLLGERVAEKV